MTDDNTDKEEAIRLKQAELKALQQELEKLVAPLGVSASTAPATATTVEDSNETAAGTSLSSGNANSTTTTTPIQTEIIQTNVKKLLSDSKITNLEAVLNKEGKLKYTTQLFEELPDYYHKELTTLILKNVVFQEYLRNKTDGIANLKKPDFIPVRLRMTNKFKLEFHKVNENLGETCSNLKKWKDRNTQFQEDMKQIIISQAQFDLAKRRKFILTSILEIIFNLTTGFVKSEHVWMNETLPKTNNGYVTAGILKFIANKPPEFFVYFAHHKAAVRQHIKRQEFDSDARKAEVELLLGEDIEDDDTTATSAEINFVGRISTWLHEFISPALLDTMKGVDDWK